MLRTLSILLLTSLAVSAAETTPLKVLICTGDYGMWAQENVPMLNAAVEKAAPGSVSTWESHQSYDFTRVLESPAYAARFDVIVIADVGIGSLTPEAQRTLVGFVEAGGGLVWSLCGKCWIPFSDVAEAVPMPLAEVLPVAYPDFSKPHAGATVLNSSDPFFVGLDWAPLTDEGARKGLAHLIQERSHGKGRVIALADGMSRPRKMVGYATYEAVPGGWFGLPDLGKLWSRVLQRAGATSPQLGHSMAEVDARKPERVLAASLTVDATKQIDEVRAANFSIVALQQLYKEDGGKNEDLFLALNPHDWFDRRSQEVLPITGGKKSDKAAFFADFNIRGIYMGDNSYGGYSKWDDAKYAEQIAAAIAAKEKWPKQLAFFQAGNEPPLDKGYVAFHKRFIEAVLKGSPSYQVIGPNKAFNLLGVNPQEMEFYLENCGSTTDVLNWHTYAQPPSTVLAEARYWSTKAAGRMRTAGPAHVMFTESDAWNQGRSQFNYLMDRAFAFLPEPIIIGNFQYCMDSRFEGGTYWFGVLQPEGLFSANYNGYWAWRNLRGRLVSSQLDKAATADGVHAIASIARDGSSVTVVAHYGIPCWRTDSHSSTTKLSMTVALPLGTWQSVRSDIRWDHRGETPGAEATGSAKLDLDLDAGSAVAITWTRK